MRQQGNTKLQVISSLKGIGTGRYSSPERAGYMQNLLCKNGALAKRNGVRDLFSICDQDGNALPINGIYDYLGTKIIHAGQYLFNLGTEPLYKKETGYTPVQIKSELALENKVLDGFVHQGRLWLVTNKELAYYDGNELALLGEGAYVPTTRVGIEANGTGSAAQAENLLTDRRRNKIKGTKAAKSSFELDCFANEERPFALICHMDVSLNDTEAQSHAVGHTVSERMGGDDVSGVLGGASLNEVAKMLDGRGTSFGFDAISETNIFLKAPVFADTLILNAQTGSTLPKIKVSYGAQTVYESSELPNSASLNLSSEIKGKLVDSITIYGNNTGARISTLSLRGKRTYQGEVELYFEGSKTEMNKVYNPTKITTPDGVALSGLYESLDGSRSKSVYISFSRGLNSTVLNMGFDAPCYNLGRENIMLTFSRAGVQVPKISLARECKTDTGAQILALCLNDTALGFTSDEVGFSYLPSTLYVEAGAQKKITALCQMHGTCVGVYTKDESYLAKIVDGGIKYSALAQGSGCENNRCAITVGSDTLTLCQNGVYGAQGEKSDGASIRSSAISEILKNCDLEDAFCLEDQGKVYFFLNEKCLVCDTTYKAKSQLGSGYEYEWFLLTGLDSRCARVLDGKIYLGTKNGKIRTLYEGFCDILCDFLQKGEFLFVSDEEGTTLYLSGELGDCDNAQISIENAKIVLSRNIVPYETEYGMGFVLARDEMLYKDGTARLFTGMEILASAQGEMHRARILEIDEYEGTISTSLSLEYDYDALFKDSKNAKITIKKSADGYKTYENGDEISLIDYENASVLLTHALPVVATYESARLCPDGVEKLKNLHQISLDLLPCTSGEITLGYVTDKSTAEEKRVLGKGLDFANLSFGALDLGARLGKEGRIRCFERGVSSVIIKITSSAPSDFALNGISLAYTLTGHI